MSGGAGGRALAGPEVGAEVACEKCLLRAQDPAADWRKLRHLTHAAGCPKGTSPPADNLDDDLDSARDLIVEAFQRLGGLDALVRWGKKQPAQFYRLWAQMERPTARPGRGGGDRQPRKGATPVFIKGLPSGE